VSSSVSHIPNVTFAGTQMGVRVQLRFLYDFGHHGFWRGRTAMAEIFGKTSAAVILLRTDLGQRDHFRRLK